MMSGNWMPLKNFHDWNVTDMIPVGEIFVWDDLNKEYFQDIYNEEFCPSNGYTFWCKTLEPPKKAINILDVMKGILEGKSYRRPAWFSPHYKYPSYHLRNDPKLDYTLSRVDIMAEDWYEVKDV